jgi:hypothetical protein
MSTQECINSDQFVSTACNYDNQYYTDVIDSECNLLVNNCFNGEEVYPPMKDFNFRNFLNYKSKNYYEYINSKFDKYSFPPDYKSLTFDDICDSKDYSLKQQQKFAGRIFNTHVDNNGILIYHGLGSGKTQTSIVIGEAFKFRNAVNNERIPGRTDTRVLIVVPASLVEQYYSEIIGFIEDGKIKSASGQIIIQGSRQFYLDKVLRGIINRQNVNIDKIKNQLIDPNISRGEYDTLSNKLIGLETSLKEFVRNERKKIDTVYEITSHTKFINGLFNNYDTHLTKSNGLLIIDEVHRLVSATGAHYRKLLLALKYNSNPNFKVVLLSGSPIYDKPYEIGLTLNLLRPRLKFPDLREKFDEIFMGEYTPEGFSMKNPELFKKMCNGYISYFKGGNPKAYPYKKTIIMHHSMNEYQYSVYKKVLKEEIEKDKTGGTPDLDDTVIYLDKSENVVELTGSMYNNSRLFCNIVFPEFKTPAGEVLNEKAKYAKTGLDVFKRILTQKGLKSTELLLKEIERYSTKFASVARLIELSKGPVFVYSYYIYYGVKAMATIMDLLGYREYKPGSQLHNDGKTYFIWKGGLDQQVVAQAKNIYNSIENKNGSLIKIMFGTQSIMEGVDFKRVRQVHILEPWWNDSRMQQIIARAIRLCSHKGLPPDERVTDVFIHLSVLSSNERLFKVTYSYVSESGEELTKTKYSKLNPINPNDNPNNWKYFEAYVKMAPDATIQDIIDLKQNVFSATQIKNIKRVVDPELTAAVKGHKNLDVESVDEYMYSRSLKKLSINREFEKAVKEISIDCTINKNGNIIRLDEKYIPHFENYSLEYENYSTGDKYIRMGIKSISNPKLPENILTLNDILNNVALKSSSFNFKNVKTGEIINFDKSLIVPEDIKCDIQDYSFDGVHSIIANLTINSELGKYLIRLSIEDLKNFLRQLERNQATSPETKKMIQRLYSKESLEEKDKIIEKIKKLGIGEEDTPWELETTESLKKLYNSFIKKNID